MIAEFTILEEQLAEEVDLRPYIEAVTRNWKWIIGAAILAALVALVISYLIPPTYEATALVAVTEPRQIVQFDPRIQEATQDLPIKAYPELATSDQILVALLNEATLIAPDVTSLQNLKGLVSAETGSDSSLLRLSVQHGEPETASIIANKWAELFVIRASGVFGAQGDSQLGFFEDQLLNATQQLNQLEEELIVFQTSNRSKILENELSALQQTQVDQLAMQRQIALLLQDVEALQEQYAAGNAGNEPTTADQLAAILLQLRAFGGIKDGENASPWQLQINIDQLAGIDRQEQIDFLDSLQNTLATQAEQIDGHLTELEPRILEVQEEKQEAMAEESRLNRDLKIAEDTYIALAHQVQEERITSTENNSGVRLASRSIPPNSPISPRKSLNVLAAAMGAVFIVLLIIILHSWWRSGESPSS
jgi:polysaccharide biosynthesis transport protein